eukprot:595107-Amphidinium_carterae.1
MLLRLDRLLTRANQVADLHISWAFRAWLMMSVLRLPPRKWSQFLDRCNNRIPRTEQEYRQLEELILREHTLEETLHHMAGMRNSTQSHTLPRAADHWDGQRYNMDEDVDSLLQYENDAYTLLATTRTTRMATRQVPNSGAKLEDLADPYSAERLSAKYTRALNDP